MAHHEKKEEKKKEKDWSQLIFVPIVAGVLAGPLIGLWEECGTHVYGTTPTDLVSVQLLDSSPKQIGHALRETSVYDTYVVAKFKKSAGGPYKSVTFRWSKNERSAPNEIELDSEEHEGTHGEEAIDALRRHFPGLHDGSYRWAHTTIRVDEHRGDASFEIDGTRRSNPLFDRQLEAGRQVLLNVVFGTPISVSDKEIADVLGSGYRIADVGKIDPATPIEGAHDTVTRLFPGADTSRRDTFKIPLDHPIFVSADLGWTNAPNGPLHRLDLRVSDAYKASRPLLAKCLEQKLGVPPRETVTDYAAGKKDISFTIGTIRLKLQQSDVDVSYGPYDGSFAQLFNALDGCRDAHETGSSSRNEKK